MKYIKDENKIRHCTSNISKMNVFEYIYYSVFHWSILWLSIVDIYKCFLKLINIVFELISNILAVLFFPVLIIIASVLDIRFSKKIIKNNK